MTDPPSDLGEIYGKEINRCGEKHLTPPEVLRKKFCTTLVRITQENTK